MGSQFNLNDYMKKNYYYNVELLDGKIEKINIDKIKKLIFRISKNINNIDQKWLLEDCLRNIFNGIKIKELNELIIMSAKSLIEKEPNYSIFAARLLIKQLEIEMCKLFNIFSKEERKNERLLQKILFKNSIKFG